MEGHTCLHDCLILGTDNQLSLFVVEANAEAKAGWDVQVGIFLQDLVLGCDVSGADRRSDLQRAD